MYRIISKKELNRLNETCKNYKEIADEYEKGFNEGNYTIKSQADIIRNMDTLIFQMSQCLDWPSMRPYFQSPLFLVTNLALEYFASATFSLCASTMSIPFSTLALLVFLAV